MTASSKAELHVETKGNPSDPAVLLIHGLMGAARNLRRVADGLSKRGFFVISYDQRGHGHSPWSHDYTLPELARDALSVLDRFQIRRAHFVGHSMGGRVSIAVSGLAPERIKSLTLMDVGPSMNERALQDIRNIIDPLPDFYPNKAAADEDLKRQSPLIAQFLYSNLRKTGPNPMPGSNDPEPELHWVIDLKGLRRFLNLGIRVDQSAFLRNANFPILMMRGEKSRHVTEDEMKNIHALNPDHIEIATVPAAGHWVHAENFDGTFDLLIRFLEKHRETDH